MYALLNATFQLHPKLTHCWTCVCTGFFPCFDTEKSFLMFVQAF